jgi:universal stress protein A
MQSRGDERPFDALRKNPMSMSVARILVPTDYSEYSREAFALGLHVAATVGAPLDLLHVWSAPYFTAGYGLDSSPLLVDPVSNQSIFDLVRNEAVSEMLKFAASVPAPPGVALSTHVESGEPLPAILEFVKKRATDLLVVGTHGRTGAERWLLGSVAERLMRLAPCPVLTVPPRQRNAA